MVQESTNRPIPCCDAAPSGLMCVWMQRRVWGCLQDLGQLQRMCLRLHAHIGWKQGGGESGAGIDELSDPLSRCCPSGLFVCMDAAWRPK